MQLLYINIHVADIQLQKHAFEDLLMKLGTPLVKKIYRAFILDKAANIVLNISHEIPVVFHLFRVLSFLYSAVLFLSGSSGSGSG